MKRVEILALAETLEWIKSPVTLEAAAILRKIAELAPTGWVDEFGNAFPLSAHSLGTRLSWSGAHKRGWRPLYTLTGALDD